MSEPLKIAMTALFAVAVFVVGQIIQRLFIEPIQNQRLVIGKIAHALTFYANVGPVPLGLTAEQFSTPATTAEAMKAVRGLAADLRATVSTIPFYRCMAALRLAMNKDDVMKASAELIGMSNSFGSHDASKADREKTIIACLKLKHR